MPSNPTNDKAETMVASLRQEIAAVDDKIIGEVVGVAQAIGELRKALAKVEDCLDRRDFEKAANLGYGQVSSGFVFLQRTLGGLHGLCTEKSKIVQKVAAAVGCAYEEALPHVEALMQSVRLKEALQPGLQQARDGSFAEYSLTGLRQELEREDKP